MGSQISCSQLLTKNGVQGESLDQTPTMIQVGTVYTDYGQSTKLYKRVLENKMREYY